MKKYIALIALLAFAQAGYGKDKQETPSTLYEVQVSPNVTELPNSEHVGNVSVGPKGKKVSIRVTWSAGKDDSGCLRIVNLKVARMGGDPSMVISGVRHAVIPECMMKFDSPDSTRYQMAFVSLDYVTKVLLKTYSFSGGIASIQGNGEFIPR